MLPIQAELHKVSVELREQLIVGLMQLRENPDLAIVARYRCEGNEYFSPDFRIKYMNTAEGMQIGFHDVIGNGLGGGQYLPIDEEAMILILAFSKLSNRIVSQNRFADTFDREEQRVADIDLILIDESKQSLEHNSHLELENLFQDEEIITLELPKQTEG